MSVSVPLGINGSNTLKRQYLRSVNIPPAIYKSLRSRKNRSVHFMSVSVPLKVNGSNTLKRQYLWSVNIPPAIYKA